MLLYVVRQDMVRVLVSEIFYSAASAGGDHIQWRGSASYPPRASLQEERRSRESGQPSVCPREAGRTLKEQETREVVQKG